MEKNTASSAPKSGGTVSRLWRVSKALIFLVLMLGLGALNVLTLVNDNAHMTGVGFLKSMLGPVLAEATMSRLLSQSPEQKMSALERSNKALKAKHVELTNLSAARAQEYAALEKSNKAVSARHRELVNVSNSRAQVVKNISTRIGRRVVINAGKNMASYAVEIVPFVGVAAITALTISDLYDDCQTLKDLNILNISFEHETNDEDIVCGMRLP